MPTPSLFLQELCQRGQELLGRTDYLAAEKILAQAEQLAWDDQDWDTLSRLYMPLQECRRQKRQIALEGTIRLNLRAEETSPEILITKYPCGQFLLAGKAEVGPGVKLRQLAMAHELYLQVFLGAEYLIGGYRAIVVVGLEDARLRAMEQVGGIDELIHQVPPHSLILTQADLADQTAAHAMVLWQRLHLPYLASADAEVDPFRRMAAYRKTIQVDNACELAHQKLADVAAKMSRNSL